MVFHHKNYTLFFRVTMQGEVVCLTFLEKYHCGMYSVFNQSDTRTIQSVYDFKISACSAFARFNTFCNPASPHALPVGDLTPCWFRYSTILR